MTATLLTGDARAVLVAPSLRDRVRARSAQVVRDIFAEHFPGPVSVLDVTCGTGGFWTWPYQAAGIVLTTSDLDPARTTDVHFDFRAIPVHDRTYDVVVFDPPFTAAGCSDWAHKYGICRTHRGPRNTHETGAWLVAGVRECCRVAQTGVVVKYKDSVESGKLAQHWPSAIAAARDAGWGQVDEWRTYGQRPQPKGRTYTTTVEPSRYVVLKPVSQRPV